MSKRKLRMGMVGGGKDAFIGAIHRIAANMDGLIELAAGALSINEEIARDSGKMLFLPEDRTYTNFEEMIHAEAKQPADKRLDFITIVTPNFAHFAPAMLALENGFNVVIEKPITFTIDEARQLKKKLEETGLLLFVSCNLTWGSSLFSAASSCLTLCSSSFLVTVSLLTSVLIMD